MKAIFVPLTSLLLFSACGGGGSGDGINTGNAEADALLSRAENVFDTIETLEDAESFSPFAAVGAETGSVSYDGVATLIVATEDAETVDYLAFGSFSVVADFGLAQDVTGTADGFFEVSNPERATDDNADISDVRVAGPVNGSFTFDLDIQDDFGDAVANGSVSGSLTSLNGTIISLDNSSAEGEFYGNNLDAIDVTADNVSGNQVTALSGSGLR